MINIRNKKITKVLLILIFTLALVLGCIRNEYAVQNQGESELVEEKISVSYNTHIENVGWERDFSKKDGQTAGTSGRSLRLEAIKIKGKNLPEGVSIKYQTHVQDVGWQSWKKDGELSGTSGRSLRLEGIRIKLDSTDRYSIMYRVHVQNIGWQDWKVDGDLAGTTGQSLRLEAIEIKIVDKIQKGKLKIESDISNTYYKDTEINVSGWKMTNISNTKIEATFNEQEISNINYTKRTDVINNRVEYGTETQNPNPGFNFKINTTGLATGEYTLKIELKTQDNKILQSYSKKIKVDRNMHIEYQAHVQNIGWQGYNFDGNTAGTTGRSLSVEGIKIKGINVPNGVKIKYKAHVQNIGWQNWVTEGQLAGTTGQSLRIEGIEILLDSSDDYTLMYRAHVQNIGWQPWKTDGELAGTTGQNLGIEALEIKIVPKVEKASINVESNIKDIYYSDTEISVSGWKMANVADSNLVVTFNEEKIEDINYTKRTDVINNVIKYGTKLQNPTPGFNFKIDISNLETGTYPLKIELKNKYGKVLKTYEKEINIDREIHVTYKSHIQNVGWQNYKMDGALSGTTGNGLGIQCIKIEKINLPETINLKYQVHVQNVGWKSWEKEGKEAGTMGQDLNLEAIRIKLEGTEEYSITYRVHVGNVGWQAWCYDGETAGTETESKRIEAIEIKIVPKITSKKVSMKIEVPGNTITQTSHTVRGWLMSNYENISIKMFIDNKEVKGITRVTRQDVLNNQKGYGDESIYNPKPGFQVRYDFGKLSLGMHNIKVQAISNDEIIKEVSKQFTVVPNIYYTTGTYGRTGLKVAGDGRGRDLTYYQYGSGPNVFFATFAIHGWEDLWSQDGQELVEIANNFYQRLKDSMDYDIANKWTIYIFPGVNLDGITYGWTNYGPGRTTLYSNAPEHKGIDLNRCWQIDSNYQRYTGANYNGTTGFQAYEAQYLRDFLLNHKSQNGQTILVDLHGWTQQVIGDSGICEYYSKEFPENNKNSVGRYGTGYLINWARTNLGSSTKAARSALIELPDIGVNSGHQVVLNNRLSDRYINATIDMLKGV